MPVVPYLMSQVLGDLASPRTSRSRSVFDQNFGVGLVHDDLVHPNLTRAAQLAGHVRPWRHRSILHGLMSNDHEHEGFKVHLDVQHFHPKEINVKVLDDFVVVECKHEERDDDHGLVSRQFQRRYKIPEDVDHDTIVSKLSTDGVLSIEASKKTPAPDANGRVIQITHTNAPSVILPLPRSAEQKGTGKGESTEKMDQ